MKVYKFVYVFIFMSIISILPPLVEINIIVNNIVMIVLYTICWVMFFIGKRRFLSLDLSEIKHPIYLNALKKNIKWVRESFIWLLICVTIFFVIAQCLDKLDLSIPFFDYRVFTMLTLLEAIAYYDCNCRGIKRLNNEILELR